MLYGKAKEYNSYTSKASEEVYVDLGPSAIPPLPSESEETINKDEKKVGLAASVSSVGSCPCPSQTLHAKRTKKHHEEKREKLSEQVLCHPKKGKLSEVLDTTQTKSSFFEMDNQHGLKLNIGPSPIFDMSQQLNSHETNQELALASAATSSLVAAVHSKLSQDFFLAKEGFNKNMLALWCYQDSSMEARTKIKNSFAMLV
ncbi:hypothetical protein REPUB_Repub05bG0194200 [Reevesia pubescens]